MSPSAVPENDRVAVSLKTLVDLAKPAAMLNMRPRQIRAAQSGNYLSHFKGRGMAFAETRLYQPGDDVRRMDWRVTARTDKPHSKVFCEERERPLFISVDYRPGMAFATRGVFKSVQAAKLAALLAWAALRRGDRIGGQIFSDAGCLELRPRSGKAALLRFFDALTLPVYPDGGGNDLTSALARLQHHAHPGSRIYLISDFRGLDPLAENHLALIARHCEVVLLQIFDPLESRLPEKGRYRFTDKIRDILLDTGESRQSHAYQRRFQERQAHLKQLCRKLRMTLLTCATNQSPIEVLSATHAQWTA
ncbi:DUF58 domain-containing protein [Methylomonas sp. SURF-2]|uniref:DUF58 domain-containing protein n=1 Tax=Methylomonas subterranea TaxID=2952225 RepID=A0ABT1TDB2_9GAMM|nr:DUF58 domain-containing protein [Methylomonas sp. SURF-2]MCQ8103430.1 DUF58 domain-containing protein [Methylomonas sp. SURF-2]